jgi:hypothetical protein
MKQNFPSLIGIPEWCSIWGPTSECLSFIRFERGTSKKLCIFYIMQNIDQILGQKRTERNPASVVSFLLLYCKSRVNLSHVQYICMSVQIFVNSSLKHGQCLTNYCVLLLAPLDKQFFVASYVCNESPHKICLS